MTGRRALPCDDRETPRAQPGPTAHARRGWPPWARDGRCYRITAAASAAAAPMAPALLRRSLAALERDPRRYVLYDLADVGPSLDESTPFRPFVGFNPALFGDRQMWSNLADLADIPFRSHAVPVPPLSYHSCVDGRATDELGWRRRSWATRALSTCRSHAAHAPLTCRAAMAQLESEHAGSDENKIGTNINRIKLHTSVD